MLVLVCRSIPLKTFFIWRSIIGVCCGLLLVLSAPLCPPPGSAYAATGKIYYLDCGTGSDTASGTSPLQAWRTLSRANQADLFPGDVLLLKRNCAWTGPLRAQWTGTASAPIRIGTYGTGNLPLIQNAPATNVVITGAYQILEYLETRGNVTNVDPGCQNQPVGWQAGFEFRGSAAYNTLRHSKASYHTAGVNSENTTHHNKVFNNTLVSNNVLKVLTPKSVSATDDVGAWGMVLKGYNQEVAFNYFANNNAWCSYDEGTQGNSIELFEARNNAIHHNQSLNDKVFSELGGSVDLKSDTNTFAYNRHVSTRANARFLVVRGGKSAYGPTWRTKVYNNTVYFTGAGSQGVVCDAGCSSSILSLRSNILWAVEKVVYSDAPLDEGTNLYWSTSGNPVVQLENSTMSKTSRIANPQFVDRARQNFRVQATSPAINGGPSVTAGYARDLDGVIVPQSLAVDIGAYEYEFD